MLPALRRRVRASAGTGRRHDACGQRLAAVTKLLHRSRASTIDEMNCVRKHLSRVKGRSDRGGVSRKATTLAHCVGRGGRPARRDRLRPNRERPNHVRRGGLRCCERLPADAIRHPPAVLRHLEAGNDGQPSPRRRRRSPRTWRTASSGVTASRSTPHGGRPEELGYRVLDLGRRSFVEGRDAAASPIQPSRAWCGASASDVRAASNSRPRAF